MNSIENITVMLTRINNIINEALPEENVSILIKEKEKLEQELNTINTYNRNIIGIQEMAINELTTENENITQYREFIRSNSRNSLIAAPTQVGKTNAIFEFVNVALDMNFPIIISCDNKTNQFEQIYQRIKLYFAHNNKEVSILKGKNNFYKKIIRNYNNNQSTVIICLDNAAQIQNVKNNIILASTNGRINFRKFVLIHDEGDVITKDKNIETVDENQSKSHQEWLNLINYFEGSNINLKRVFVSATPENVVYKYNIDQIFILNIPNNYTGFDKINYKNLNDDANIINILLYEENKRIQQNLSGVILYSIERKISDGHDIVFKDICENLSCTVSIYNSFGITARLEKAHDFERVLVKFINFKKRKEKTNITYTKETEDEIVFNMPNISIADFYTVCKCSNNNIVITIGMDLLARGISFVSTKDNRNNVDNSLAATTMIYRPGERMHAVGICQSIGRITGTARSDLERTLYAPEKVIKTYKNFNLNQRQYFKELRENNSYMSKEIMETIELNNKLHRPLDRPRLGLKPKYKREDRAGPSRNTEQNEENKMHRLVDSWKEPNNISTIAKIFRKMIENNGKLENSIVRDLCTNHAPSFYTNLTAPISLGNSLGLVFRCDGRYHYIKDEVKNYIR